ncbi:hypothetical protein H072_4254 [Dactylellina haptotyla CBS 200.50]|uniref:F-box domain-containing protein n=1 Tax=Dactylellina haptotyla (strain CBS 200.50) TaxID=1284197 RepID=S8AFG6_DACHA|nr:hypothetical protein H072_4254 [Dactylellina haptotyla CBS 200.50]
MGATLLTLLSAGQPIFYEAIFGYLEACDVLRLLATCRQIHDIERCIFDVDRQLRPFVKEPLKFRQIMATYNLVVSGSVALKLFSRDSWKSADLDIYTSSTKSLLATWGFLKREKYIFEPYVWHSATVETSVANLSTLKERLTRISRSSDEDDDDDIGRIYASKEIRDVYRFVRPKDGSRVEIILTRGLEIEAITDGYYSTYIMNFFTYRKAYCLFPYHTISRREGFRTVNFESEKTAIGFAKYSDRGYKVEKYGDYHPCKLHCPLRPHRRIGDCFTWSITFPTEKIFKPAVESILEAYTFGLKAHSSFEYGDEPRQFTSKEFIYLSSVWFTHKLLAQPLLIDDRTDSWAVFLKETLDKIEKQRHSYFIADPLLQADTVIKGRDRLLDAEVPKYYQYWYDTIMPGEFIWRGQYPMLQ